MIFYISGQPVVLKNSKRIVKQGRRTMLIPSNKVLKAEQGALVELLNQKRLFDRGTFPIKGPIQIRFSFLGAWKYNAGNVPDLTNLCEAPQDWLQKAKIIEDDRQVESVDGTRRICMCPTCPKRQIYKRGERKGQFKEDCGAVKKCKFEQTRIEIIRMEEL